MNAHDPTPEQDHQGEAVQIVNDAINLVVATIEDLEPQNAAIVAHLLHLAQAKAVAHAGGLARAARLPELYEQARKERPPVLATSVSDAPADKVVPLPRVAANGRVVDRNRLGNVVRLVRGGA